MKKTILIFIGILLFTSCRSKRKLVSNPNYKTPNKTVVKSTKIPKTDEKETSPIVTDPIVSNENINNTVISSPVNEQQVIITSTEVNNALLDNLMARKPNLMQAKIDYIKKYNALAINEMYAYNIPASITLAQGLLESRYGQSQLTKSSKNHFGIKCHNWTGDRVYHDDDTKGECFRKYKYDENSYRDHSLFLAKKKRYKKLFTYDRSDYKSWAKGLRKAGYATDKKYPKKLINLIETYELYQFDKQVLGTSYRDITNIPSDKQINSNRVHTVVMGETLYSISGVYYISVENIKRFNSLKSNNLTVGQKIKLYKTVESEVIAEYNSVGNSIKYAVQAGDTIYGIAKKHKISIDKLKQQNNLQTNEISIGQLLIIQ